MFAQVNGSYMHGVLLFMEIQIGAALANGSLVSPFAWGRAQFLGFKSQGLPKRRDIQSTILLFLYACFIMFPVILAYPECDCLKTCQEEAVDQLVHLAPAQSKQASGAQTSQDVAQIAWSILVPAL